MAFSNSANLSRLLEDYQKIIDLSIKECVPCYVSSSIVGFTPSTYLSTLSELSLSGANKETLELLRITDLNNFLIVLEDDNRTVGGLLFKPLFQLPEMMNDEIPSVKVSFSNENFNLEEIIK